MAHPVNPFHAALRGRYQYEVRLGPILPHCQIVCTHLGGHHFHDTGTWDHTYPMVRVVYVRTTLSGLVCSQSGSQSL